MWSALYFCLILTKPEFSPHILIKVPSTQFHKNLFHRAKLFNVGCWNDRHDNAVTFCKFVNELKNWRNCFTSFCHPGTQLRLLWITTRTIQHVHLTNKVLHQYTTLDTFLLSNNRQYSFYWLYIRIQGAWITVNGHNSVMLDDDKLKPSISFPFPHILVFALYIKGGDRPTSLWSKFFTNNVSYTVCWVWPHFSKPHFVNFMLLILCIVTQLLHYIICPHMWYIVSHQCVDTQQQKQSYG
jgi:hypothetical protein